jgi:hypothetical protein
MTILTTTSTKKKKKKTVVMKTKCETGDMMKAQTVQTAIHAWIVDTRVRLLVQLHHSHYCGLSSGGAAPASAVLLLHPSL